MKGSSVRRRLPWPARPLDRGRREFTEGHSLHGTGAVRGIEVYSCERDLIGQNIAHYRITAKLGEGGMGAVYRATDTKLDRQVAIKVLPPAVADDPDRLARFTREAKVLASLNHPNIAAIYGVEERALVMELVEGETLKVPMPVAMAVDYAHQITGALDYAHEKNIIHRDLKPANIMVTAEGVVKLLDFGIAKIAEPQPASGIPPDAPTLTMRATELGLVIGTAAYMAPEQARGQPVDKRADIWAFGVVLYEMVTGERMFSGETISDTLAQVLTKELDLNSIPPRIRPLLDRCLQRDKKKRLRDLGDAWTETQQVAASGQRPILLWGAAAAVALIAGIALWNPWKTTPSKPLLHVDIETGSDEIRYPAISPDGMRVAFVSRNQLATRRLDERKVTVLRGTEGARFPFFSPDARSIAFFASEKLQKIPVDGGPPTVVCDALNGRGGTWGDDGTIVFTSAPRVPSQMLRVTASGGRPQPIAEGAQGRWPQLLPGGKAILFTLSHGGTGSICVLASGTVKTLVPNAATARYLPSGHLIYSQQGTLYSAPMDLRRMELAGPPSPLAPVRYEQGFLHADFDVSAAGTLTYVQGEPDPKRVISWLDSAGNPAPLLTQPDDYGIPRISPDGTRIFYRIGLGNVDRKFLIRDLARGTTLRLDFVTLGIAWARGGEGDFLVMASGEPELAWMRADGSGKAERIRFEGASNVYIPSFSPRGDLIAVAVRTQGDFDIWTAKVDRTGNGFRVTQPKPFLQQPGSNQHHPSVSPDGRWLAYQSDESGVNEVYVVPFVQGRASGAGKWLVSIGGGMQPCWSPNGKSLYYVGADRRIYVVISEARGDTFIPGKPRPFSEIRVAVPQGGGFTSYDVAPDGRLAVVVPADEQVEKPQTALRVVLNLGDELRRRGPVAK